ncbi:MAG: hypothetical protein ABIN01_07040 [Ferruginibacter sp.]
MNYLNVLETAHRENEALLAKLKELQTAITRKDRLLYNAFRKTDPPVLRKKPPYDIRYQEEKLQCFQAYLNELDKMEELKLSFLTW